MQPLLDRPQAFWRDECLRLEAAIRGYLAADGNDLCHVNRQELAAAIGMATTYPQLPSENEFALGCSAYRQALYGLDGPGSETAAWEQRVRELEKDNARLRSDLLIAAERIAICSALLGKKAERKDVVT